MPTLHQINSNLKNFKMKKIILTLLTVTLFVLTSCNTNKVATLTDQDKTIIKTEVQAVLKQIVESSEARNFEKATEPYADIPEFIAISNGVITDYADFIKSNKDFFDALDNQKYTETDLMFTFIDKKNVILTYGGSALVTMKDLQQIKVDPFAATLVFTKIDDSWKVIYSSETAIFIPIVEDSTIIK
jgi:hypothetical protein